MDKLFANYPEIEQNSKSRRGCFIVPEIDGKNLVVEKKTPFSPPAGFCPCKKRFFSVQFFVFAGSPCADSSLVGSKTGVPGIV